MSATIYSGTLQAKKKGELQELASSLRLATTGTREDLQARIRSHLDTNEHLSEEPAFVGLYPKKRGRKESAPPTSQSGPVKEVEVSSSDEAARTQRKVSRTVVRKHSPPSVVLPVLASPARVPLPASPVNATPVTVSPVRAMLAEAANRAAPDAQAVVQAVKSTQRTLLADAERGFYATREFLSNSGNIASITVLFELLAIIYTIVPWEYFLIPLNPPFKATPPLEHPPSAQAVSSLILHVPYPPLDYVLSRAPWNILAAWGVPTLVIPQLFGALISFSRPKKEIDPLSAGIVRLAIAVAGNWSLSETVLSSKWRVLSAAISVAFALSEAVAEKRAA